MSGPIPHDLLVLLRRHVARKSIEGAAASLGMRIGVLEKMLEYGIATADRIRRTRTALAKARGPAVVIISDREIARRVRAGELVRMVLA